MNLGEWSFDAVRRAAMSGGSFVVLTRLRLASHVRDALAVAGRGGDLREVRLYGYSPSLPVDGASRRIDPVGGVPGEAWQAENGILSDESFRGVLGYLREDVGTQSVLPALTLEEATAPARVVTVVASEKRSFSGMFYALWLMRQGVVRARGEGRPEPVLIVDDEAESDANFMLVRAFGFRRMPTCDAARVSVVRPAEGSPQEDRSERPRREWERAIDARDALHSVERDREWSWIAHAGRCVAVFDERTRRTVVEALPDGRIRTRSTDSPMTFDRETARTVWNKGILAFREDGGQGLEREEELSSAEVRALLAAVPGYSRMDPGGPDYGLHEAVRHQPRREEIGWAVACDPDRRGRRRDFVATWPALSGLLLEREVREAIDAGVRMTPFLARRLGSSQAIVRRLVGATGLPTPTGTHPSQDGHVAHAIAFLDAIGHDRLPPAGDRAGWSALTFLASWVARFHDGLAHSVAARLLLSIPGGDWEARRRHMDTRSRPDDAVDMASALARWLSELTGEEVAPADAKEILAGHGGLHRIALASDRWHAHELLQGDVEGLPIDLSWPVPFDPVRCGDGLEIRVLSTVRDLVDEGAHGPDSRGAAGLAHCVGGYGKHCQTGRCLVLSVRRVPEAGGARLSTAELIPVVTGTFRLGSRAYGLRQHRGRLNADAPGEAEDAIHFLREELAACRVPIREEALEPRPAVPPRRSPESAACFLQAWRCILPGEWSALDLDALVARVEGMSAARGRHGEAPDEGLDQPMVLGEGEGR